MKADFHVHSEYSPDSNSNIDLLYEKAKSIGLGKLIITDHNETLGAQRLQEKHPDYVIVGEEIKTTEGEFLACFVKEKIPQGLTPEKTLDRLLKQNAFISMSHPAVFGELGWKPKKIAEFAPYIDAIEISNARNDRIFNIIARHWAKKNKVFGTAGSDSHTIPELGGFALELPEFSTVEELRESIKTAHVVGHEYNPIIRYKTYFRIMRMYALGTIMKKQEPATFSPAPSDQRA